MSHAIMLAYIPHGDHGFWLWSIHDHAMKCIATPKPGSKGYKTPEEALVGAKEYIAMMEDQL
jgi:hypothetical protein